MSDNRNYFLLFLLIINYLHANNAAPQTETKKMEADFNKSIMEKMSKAYELCKIKTGGAMVPPIKQNFDLMKVKQPEKCFLTCMMTEVGVVNNDQFTPDDFYNTVPKELVNADVPDMDKKIEELNASCKTTVNRKTRQDECQISIDIFECVISKAQELGIPITILP